MTKGLPTFLKWAGGKTQLIDQFNALFPESIKRYFEPFVGSGAVFFYVKNKFNPKEVLISDINDELINCFKVVRDDLAELMILLEHHKLYHSKRHFYEVREMDPEKLPRIEAAARFIYLNKTCYNGLYRVNKQGKFNVPFGSHEKRFTYSEKNLHEANSLLQEANIRSIPFEKIVNSVKKGDFVYFDPPYYPLTKTSSFTNYTKFKFLQEEQKKLADVFKELDKRGCLLMLSNSDHKYIHSLYGDYNIRVVHAKRQISCNGLGRGKIKEIVVRNFD